ncbi:hypothetical protein PA598K_05930 [Paenibacillus sp. 598K]|uniref:contact-dependent growth inhibition system immunity protein n=1 Tax=Paenibacillus sp. 598K TaxID=1117987 RepID=UPI000FF9757C|nr:contact-dependent growth inhibition system immunity protein [Paenibacillus sp. 598K]GBF77382.1 hypothetical protein PA598K_05930 [Paenibacillus sp. 598K]
MELKGKTLEELDGEIWAKPEFQSALVKKIHQLRKKPITNFTNEDLRLCLSQQEGLEYLVPVALQKISNQPFHSGDLFVGDLLVSVLRIKGDFWDKNPHLYIELRQLIAGVKEVLKRIEEQLIKFESLDYD